MTEYVVGSGSDTEPLAFKIESNALKEKARISVDFGKGRWGKTFHLFDGAGHEIILTQKDAVELAEGILLIAKGK